jgi:hypothetical protein
VRGREGEIAEKLKERTSVRKRTRFRAETTVKHFFGVLAAKEGHRRPRNSAGTPREDRVTLS